MFDIILIQASRYFWPTSQHCAEEKTAIKYVVVVVVFWGHTQSVKYSWDPGVIYGSQSKIYVVVSNQLQGPSVFFTGEKRRKGSFLTTQQAIVEIMGPAQRTAVWDEDVVWREMG